jgi:hypothetical protein
VSAREPLASSSNETESALPDDALNGVVGGTGSPCPLHAGETVGHWVEDNNGILQQCNAGVTTTAGKRTTFP